MTQHMDTKAALERAVKVVTLAPSRGQRVYTNKASIGAGTICTVEEKGETLTMDVSKGMGGEGAGPSPSMILRSALTGCVAIGIKLWAARADVQVDAVDVTLETDVDAQGQLGVDDSVAPGFEGLRLFIEVQTDAKASLMKKIIDQSLKYSPLMDVFANPHSMNTEMSIIDSNHTYEEQAHG